MAGASSLAPNCSMELRFRAADFFSGKKDATPVGWMSDPDKPGPVILDRESWEKLVGIRSARKSAT